MNAESVDIDHLLLLSAKVWLSPKQMNKRVLSRLQAARFRGCPQELSSCVDSAEREYLPRGITETPSLLDFIDSGLNIRTLGPSDSGKSYLAKALGIATKHYTVVIKPSAAG